MRFLKNYKLFESEIMDAPAEPKVKPKVKPKTPTRRRPGPIRRDKPSVEPDPKAELPKATIKDVINKYAELTNQK